MIHRGPRVAIFFGHALTLSSSSLIVRRQAKFQPTLRRGTHLTRPYRKGARHDEQAGGRGRHARRFLGGAVLVHQPLRWTFPADTLR
jgi:hypothetical protein